MTVLLVILGVLLYAFMGRIIVNTIIGSVDVFWKWEVTFIVNILWPIYLLYKLCEFVIKLPLKLADLITEDKLFKIKVTFK